MGAFALTTAARAAEASRHKPPNVLFIAIDDLRPFELGTGIVKTPNIDRLAASAVVFANTFTTVPTCGASRCSLLTGRRPTTRAQVGNEACRLTLSGKPVGAEPETFVEALRRHGYHTVGIGKISHYPDGYVSGYKEPKGTALELPHSWDEMLLDPGKWGTAWNAFFGYADGSDRNHRDGQVPPYESAAVDDDGYPDGLTANLAVRKLREMKARGGPFFLGVGFFKPHLPFNAPKKYWDLYDESKIPLTPSPDLPRDVNPASVYKSGEFNGYQRVDEKASLNTTLTDAYQRKLRHAYFACISYADAQVGRVLDELRTLGLDRDTIVIFWGDHGWHLGDDRVWGKHTLFEWAVKCPLIIRAPAGVVGSVCPKIVSTVDVYPTLMELCGLAMPIQGDGKSLVPLLRDPANATWENAAYSYFAQGISVRTERYRLTRYFRAQKPDVELYDHRTDPLEHANVAEAEREVVDTLLPLWSRGDTGVYRQSAGH